MSYKIELTNNFKKEAKKLIKKYASLRAEIAELGKELAPKSYNRHSNWQ
ncbi:mRNA-degrading endonuclease RelE of RelBE toxin-antitoxin system [Pedobacter sp. UYP30]